MALLRETLGVSEMAHQVKALEIKPDELSSSPWTHRKWRTNKVSFDHHKHSGEFVTTHIYEKWGKFKERGAGSVHREGQALGWL